MAAAPLWLDVLIFASLALLGAGYLWKDRRAHLVRIPGFVGVGAFWLVRAAIYVEEGSDAVNIAFTGLAFPFFVYLAYHEWISFQKDEDPDPLRWATGVTFLAGLLYFSVDRLEVVASGLILTVAWQSLGLLNLFGYGIGWSVGDVGPISGELGAPVIGSGVTIILACTSFEAIAIFLGAVYATQMRQDPWADYKHVDEEKVERLRKMTPQRRKWLGLLYTVPVIWILNLVRNAGVIYLYNEHTFDAQAAALGMTPFDFAHVVLGKGLSFVALIAIAFVLFRTCPELLDNINGLMELPRRGQKGKGGSGKGPDFHADGKKKGDGGVSTGPTTEATVPQASNG